MLPYKYIMNNDWHISKTYDHKICKINDNKIAIVMDEPVFERFNKDLHFFVTLVKQCQHDTVALGMLTNLYAYMEITNERKSKPK